MKTYEAILGHAFPMSTVAVLRDIGDERDRQNRKFPDQVLPDGTRHLMKATADAVRKQTEVFAKDGILTWRDVLAEEVAEAFAEEDPERLRKELVQVAAVAARWVEDIDNRRVGIA